MSENEPAPVVAPPVAIQLSLCQQTAIEATLQDIARLQTKLAAIKAEAGLDGNVPYRLTPDGQAVPS